MNRIIINKFDTDSENARLLHGLSCLIFEMSAISRYGGGGVLLKSLKIAWKGTLIFIYVISRYRTIIPIKYEKNLITILMSFGTLNFA